MGSPDTRIYATFIGENKDQAFTLTEELIHLSSEYKPVALPDFEIGKSIAQDIRFFRVEESGQLKDFVYEGEMRDSVLEEARSLFQHISNMTNTLLYFSSWTESDTMDPTVVYYGPQASYHQVGHDAFYLEKALQDMIRVADNPDSGIDKHQMATLVKAFNLATWMKNRKSA